jgi:HSP20 family protein
VPGFSVKDLEIKVEPRRLKIAGKREIKEEKNGRKILSEGCADKILRVLDLPMDIDTTKVNANLKDGILTLDLPKAANARAVRIEPRPN